MLILPYAVSSLMSIVIVGSRGQLLTSNVTAESGSPEDVQAAVDLVAAAGVGNVYVPEGDFVFNPNDAPSGQGVQILGGVNVFGAGKNKTILRQTRRVNGNTPMFHVDGSNDLPTRISGFTFIGYVEDEVNGYLAGGVHMYNCKNFRVDHCEFVEFNHYGVLADIETVAIKLEGGEYQYYWNLGLVDHCDFDLPYKDTIGGIWGYGVHVVGPGRRDAWLYDLSDIIGQFPQASPRCALYQWNSGTGEYDLVDAYGGKFFRWLVYVEDCTFSRLRHAIVANTEGFYVARYNTFGEPRPKGYPIIDIHGAMDIDWWGGRGAEVYNNTIYAAEGYGSSCAIDYRGGGGVIFNNTIIDCYYGVRLSCDELDNNLLCRVKDLWIWNNNFQNVEVPIHDFWGGIYEEEVDYFLWERPGYTPYPYPHPLTLEGTP